MSDPIDDIEINIQEPIEDEDTEEIEVQTTEPSPLRLAASRILGRFVTKWLPFLVKSCPFGGRHWAWARLCVCGFGHISDSEEDGIWHGGVLDLKQGNELVPCPQCFPEASPHTHQWHLSDEEEYLVQAWRMYRREVLNDFGDTYRYAISVKLNNTVDTFLMGRAQGMQPFSSGGGLFSESVRPKNPKTDKPN